MNDDEDEGSTAIGTSPLMSRREHVLFQGKIYVAGWIFVFHIVPWALALMLSAFSARAVNEELIGGTLQALSRGGPNLAALLFYRGELLVFSEDSPPLSQLVERCLPRSLPSPQMALLLGRRRPARCPVLPVPDRHCSVTSAPFVRKRARHSPDPELLRFGQSGLHPRDLTFYGHAVRGERIVRGTTKHRAGADVELRAVQRAGYRGSLELALAQRTLPVGAFVLCGTEAATDVEHGHVAHQLRRCGRYLAHPKFVASK